MKIGFTGTRCGMTVNQKTSLSELLTTLKPDDVHHGDCVGADLEFANMVDSMFPEVPIICHPPIDKTHRAFFNKNAHVLEEKTHLARNRDIVNSCDVLIGCPLQEEHQSLGGTWYTIDYAEKQKKQVYIISPKGGYKL